MTTLDNPLNLPDPSEVSVKPTAIRYGVIGALILIVVGLIFNLTGFISYTDQSHIGNRINQIIQVLVLIGVVVLTIRTHRDEDLGGFIKYGRCLGVSTFAGLIVGVISAIWTFVYFTLIDPATLTLIKENAWEQALESGTSEEALESARGMMDFFTSAPWISSMVILFTVFITFIIALIAGAIMKKDRP